MSVSAVVEKVQKLLALSKSSNANEAAAAAAAANKLIDQYRLSEADLEVSGEVVEPIEEDDGYIYETGKITNWKQTLVRVLVNHYGLCHWNDTTYASGRKVSRYRLVGRRSDIVIAKYMFAWLTAECSRLSESEAKGRGRVYASSYCEGFVAGIATQLAASRADVEKTASAAAIVKIDSRSEAARAFLYSMHTNLRVVKNNSQARRDYGAFYQGQDRGKSMHLGASLNGGMKLLNK